MESKKYKLWELDQLFEDHKSETFDKIIDNKGNIWISPDHNLAIYNVASGKIIFEVYNPKDLQFIEFEPYYDISYNENKQKADEKCSEGYQNIVKLIEALYIDTKMELNNCQGCAEDRDITFVELQTLAGILRYLKIDPIKDEERLIKEWYKRKDEERKEEIENDNKLFNHIRCPIAWHCSESNQDSFYWLKTIEKINDVLDYLKNNQ